MDDVSTEGLQAAGWRARVLPGHMGQVGPLWTRRGEGGWEYGLLAEDKHLNPARLVHGGVLLTLLDHVVSVVAWELAGRRSCVTVQLDAQLHTAVRRGDFVAATARVARQTRDLVFMEGRLAVGGNEVAGAQALLKIIAG